LPSVSLLGELFPVDPVTINGLLKPMGLSAGPCVPTREWRELYQALDCAAVAAIHPFYTATAREFSAAGRPIIGSAPVGREGTASWLENLGEVCGISAAKVSAAVNGALKATTQALARCPISGRITLSGYEGSELLVGRLLVESGADLRYVGSACPATAHNKADAQWLEAHGVKVVFRASLEQDLAAVDEFEPDLAIGTTPVVQAVKERAVPALYFTNLISARPLMGPAGAGSVAQVVNSAIANKDRFSTMQRFFEGVGQGRTAGVFESVPADDSRFRKKYAAKLKRTAPQEKPMGADV
jgi:chlorophyllide a reductase subunit Y